MTKQPAGGAVTSTTYQYMRFTASVELKLLDDGKGARAQYIEVRARKLD